MGLVISIKLNTKHTPYLEWQVTSSQWWPVYTRLASSSSTSNISYCNDMPSVLVDNELCYYERDCLAIGVASVTALTLVSLHTCYLVVNVKNYGEYNDQQQKSFKQ